MRIVIIEDEPFAQNELKRLLTRTDQDIEIIAVIDSVEDAVLWFNNNEHPELVFFDIQLSDGLSFDIFAQTKISAPVIFTTAYDQYAIEAFKVNSIDYLLKPIELEALQNALNKLSNFKSALKNESVQLSNEQLESILSLSTNTNLKSRFMVRVGEQIRFIKTDEIACFYAEDNEVFLQTFGSKKYIIDFSLDQLSTMIEPLLFHRINRKFIVQKNAITGVHKYFNSRLKLELNPKRDEEVLISRVKVSEFLNWMEQ